MSKLEALDDFPCEPGPRFWMQLEARFQKIEHTLAHAGDVTTLRIDALRLTHQLRHSRTDLEAALRAASTPKPIGPK